MKLLTRLFVQWMLACSLLVTGFAMAQSEPSMDQIYSAAQAGKIDEAQVMVQQVLVMHPKSAKAHYVQAELFARQGKPDLARQALSTAEQIAPGLPFAKPEAVQALRAQLAAKPVASSVKPPSPAQSIQPAPSTSGSSWMLPLLIAGGVIAAAYFLFRRNAPVNAQPAYAPQGGLSGPQTFGTGGGSMAPAYPQPAYQGGYPQPTGTGLGGRIMGGVATGLAVGAGVMAAEAIGRNLMGGHNSAGSQADALGSSTGFEPVASSVNADMGGNNFGVSDTAWDDGGDAGSGGGSDWDN